LYGRVWVVIVFFLLEKPTFDGLLKVIGIQIRIFRIPDFTKKMENAVSHKKSDLHLQVSLIFINDCIYTKKAFNNSFKTAKLINNSQPESERVIS
jgi:hypothetical protein